MEDVEIIELYYKRDENAIEETRKNYGGYCFALANRILGKIEDAEECVNDALLSAWNSIPPQRPKFLRMFLARIVRNRALNQVKANAALKRGGGEPDLIYEEISECISDGSTIESEILAKELGSTINGFVKGLPERDGDLFVRRYFFMESVRDIAENYGMTPGNVSVNLSRTRKKLRDHLVTKGYL